MKEKNKKLKYIIIGVIILILIYLVIKVPKYYLIKQTKKYMNYNDYEEKNIKTDKSLSNTKIGKANIYLPDGFTNKNEIRENYIIYYLENEDTNNYTAEIIISNNVPFCIYDDGERRLRKDFKEFLNDNNLNNNMELVKYYYDNINNYNIFTSKNKTELIYLSQRCTRNTFMSEKSDKIYLLNGDIKGIETIERKRKTIEVYDEKNDNYIDIIIEEREREEDYIEQFPEEVLDKMISSIYFD